MATTSPGSGPDLVRGAHYHPVTATQKWAEYVKAIAQLAKRSTTERDRLADERTRETTYERDTLGKH